jgi:hypothetical protein
LNLIILNENHSTAGFSRHYWFGYPFAFRLILVAFGSLLSSISLAQTNYVAYEVARENNWTALITEDLNGDGLKDVIFPHYDPTIGREIHIHHQQADGSFSKNPQKVEIKSEIIAVGFADLREEPGKELLLFASNGVFSLSTAAEGYAGNIKQLIQWDLIAAVPDLERVQFIETIHDMNNDGYVDLLLPGDEEFAVYRGSNNESFELAATFTTLNLETRVAERNNKSANASANIGINAEEGIVLDITAEAPTPFSNFVEQWSAEANSERTLMRAESWVPSAIMAQLNDDDLEDILYLNIGSDDLGQLNIHYQQDNLTFNESADWVGATDTQGEIKLAHLNGDDKIDLFHLSSDGDQWNVRFFINKGGIFELGKPDQIMRFSGYDVRLSVIPLADSEQPALNVSYYTIPVIDAIRNASINRVQLLYGNSEASQGQLFNRRPDSSLEESFSAANVRGLSEQMSLQYDVDGDGNRDALYITDNGTLAAKRIDNDLVIADDPFWEYVSPRTVFQFEVMLLNEDELPDLLLRHGVSTTLLVTKP